MNPYARNSLVSILMTVTSATLSGPLLGQYLVYITPEFKNIIYMRGELHFPKLHFATWRSIKMLYPQVVFPQVAFRHIAFRHVKY